jgi:hypothetical protein
VGGGGGGGYGGGGLGLRACLAAGHLHLCSGGSGGEEGRVGGARSSRKGTKSSSQTTQIRLLHLQATAKQSLKTNAGQVASRRCPVLQFPRAEKGAGIARHAPTPVRSHKATSACTPSLHKMLPVPYTTLLEQQPTTYHRHSTPALHGRALCDPPRPATSRSPPPPTRAALPAQRAPIATTPSPLHCRRAVEPPHHSTTTTGAHQRLVLVRLHQHAHALLLPQELHHLLKPLPQLIAQLLQNHHAAQQAGGAP